MLGVLLVVVPDFGHPSQISLGRIRHDEPLYQPSTDKRGRVVVIEGKKVQDVPNVSPRVSVGLRAGGDYESTIKRDLLRRDVENGNKLNTDVIGFVFCRLLGL